LNIEKEVGLALGVKVRVMLEGKLLFTRRELALGVLLRLSQAHAGWTALSTHNPFRSALAADSDLAKLLSLLKFLQCQVQPSATISKFM
jgi:hypothetical protein